MKEENNNSQESKESIKIKLSILILIIAIIVIIIMAFWIYKLVQENNETSEQIAQLENQVETLQIEDSNMSAVSNNEIEEENEKISNNSNAEATSNSNNITELDIDSSIVTELHAKLLQDNYIYEENLENDTWDFDGSFYKDTKTTVDDLSNTEKIVAVLQYIEDTPSSVIASDNGVITSDEVSELNLSSELYYGDINVYSSELLNDTTEEIFGSKVDIEWKDFENGVGGSWYYLNENYYFVIVEGGGFGSGITTASEIEKAEESEDEIYIYDKFIYAVTIPSGEYWVYNSSDKTTVLDSGDEYDSDQIWNEEKLIENYEDQAQTYKHTFKKASDGTYYWYSTEQVD